MGPRDSLVEMLDVRVLGAIEAQVDGVTVTVGSQTQRALLAALVHGRGRTVPVDRLAWLVWGDDPPAQAYNSLKSHLSRLRRTLGTDAIVARPPGYALDLEPDQLDVHRFEQGVRRARTVEQLDDVLSLWRGPPYGQLAEHEHFAGEVAHLGELRWHARRGRAELLAASGRHDEAVAGLQALSAEDPLREPVWVALLTALHSAGRQADATAAARRYRELVRDAGLEPSQRFVQVERQVFVSTPSAYEGPPPLPPRSSTVVGREDKLARLRDLLQERRVITLVGPGGVGKTTLALEAARALRRSVPDGVWLADLADVDRAEAIVPSVIRAVGAPAAEPLDRSLLDYLAGRNALLVLDNCEHVHAEVRALVRQATARAPELRLLVTSRRPLAVPGEVVVGVDPLTPDHALALFRARAADAGAAVGDDEQTLAATLCERLDRLPLALEMAAARLRGLGLADLAGRLDERLRLLSSGEPGRHETLGAVVAWSYELLEEPDRRLLGELSVFTGPFDIDAAEAVCAGHDVARRLSDLVDRSLVVANTEGGLARYHLLATVRSFARERLAERDGLPAIEHRFVQHHVVLAERIGDGVASSDEATWADELAWRTPNLEGAHARALASGDVDAAVRIAAAMYVVVYQRLRADIGAWAEATLAAAREPDHLCAPAVAAVAAVNRLNRGDADGAAALLADLPDDPVARHAHEVLGDLHIYRGELDVSLDHFRRADELARDADDHFTSLFARISAAIALGYAQRADEALAVLTDARAEAVSGGIPLMTAWSDYAEGELLAEVDPARALTLVDHAVAEADAADWRMLAGVGRLTASSLRARMADPDEAVRGFVQLIHHWDRLGDATHQWTTLRNLIELLTRIDADEPAACLVGAVDGASTPTYGPERARLHRATKRLRDRLGGRTDELIQKGRGLDLPSATSLALRALDGEDVRHSP